MHFSLSYLISLAFFLAAFWMYKKILKLRARQAGAVIVPAIIHQKEVADGKYGKYHYYLHYGFEMAGRPISGKAEVGARLYDQTVIDSSIVVMVETHNAEVNYLRKLFVDRLSTYQTWCLLLAVSGLVVPWVF